MWEGERKHFTPSRLGSVLECVACGILAVMLAGERLWERVFRR